MKIPGIYLTNPLLRPFSPSSTLPFPPSLRLSLPSLLHSPPASGRRKEGCRVRAGSEQSGMVSVDAPLILLNKHILRNKHVLCQHSPDYQHMLLCKCVILNNILYFANVCSLTICFWGAKVVLFRAPKVVIFWVPKMVIFWPPSYPQRLKFGKILICI